MTDATDKRIAALEAELAAARADLQELSSTVSHDLRAPLRHIVSFARLVQEDAGPQLSAEVQGFLGNISDSAHHLGELLDGLLALSRVGTASLNVEPVNLQALVQEACTALTTQHPARTLEWRVGTDLPQVLADEALLRQALAHLLGNAVKFTAPRERAIIGISAVVGDPATGVIEIRDNGVGFNPGAHAKLFQVFGRLHGAREFEGIGMGLAITRKIVQRLGGQVQAQGMLDEGCRLLLELPISARS